MVTSQRMALDDAIRTNGASPNPWWANAVVYQIYPRSFQDSNGDGFGDLPGITSRLDYLAELGVDALWLSPVYRSPQDDNGYDISDYQDIDPLFGTLADMDELLRQAHRRGIKVIMDLVVNHTSDEHAWFQASRDKNDPHADWYWWRPARPGCEPGAPEAEPNRWGSYFGGSAWRFDPVRGEYYLHQFSSKQPDLNWENPDVRQAVFDMMNWWMDRGIDGFRMDVIVMISKQVDARGRLPGEAGGDIADGPVGAEGFSDPAPWTTDGPRLDEFLKQMRREVFSGRSGYLTVGEAPGLSAKRTGVISDPAQSELDMLFLFEQVNIDQNGSKWDILPFAVPKLRSVMRDQQEAVAARGWASLYFDNHDQPRVVSRWGDTSSEEMRSRSAKALGLVLHMHRGTPYIYQGEELGMTNAGFTRLDQYRDLESINMYHQRVDEAHVQGAQSMLHSLGVMSRDNARTPMQWDSSVFAGFTDAAAAVRPWMCVNPNHVSINAEAQRGDDDSVLAFYRELIRLRHDNPVVAAGTWKPLDEHDEHVYAFTRSLEDAPDGGHAVTLSAKPSLAHGAGCEPLVVVANLSSAVVDIPEQSLALLRRGVCDRTGDHRSSASRAVLIGTYGPDHAIESVRGGKLAPWEAFVCRVGER
ncbi:MAG: alpha-glucosidase [Bifidobacterium sp.]|jgi:oligo-1,6-glucosidase|nr:alpha-glucosidase [Bifidobacterium sp.]MCI1865216.1 alpha-glucosidase [Bifidobacterium sp.]